MYIPFVTLVFCLLSHMRKEQNGACPYSVSSQNRDMHSSHACLISAYFKCLFMECDSSHNWVGVMLSHADLSLPQVISTIDKRDVCKRLWIVSE